MNYKEDGARRGYEPEVYSQIFEKEEAEKKARWEKNTKYLRVCPFQSFPREEIVATDKDVEKQEDVTINDVLTVWQKKRQEEKLRFEECSVKTKWENEKRTFLI